MMISSIIANLRSKSELDLSSWSCKPFRSNKDINTRTEKCIIKILKYNKMYQKLLLQTKHISSNFSKGRQGVAKSHSFLGNGDVLPKFVGRRSVISPPYNEYWSECFNEARLVFILFCLNNLFIFYLRVCLSEIID